ncbi:hypothetical protein VLK31_07095 [Variovorax sp. H27-G14]|uniref:hypothetical protein n=1 Tax=Variovorax sp. H27-G14 TaxID=3111914 RepID=UPI0038FCF1BA
MNHLVLTRTEPAEKRTMLTSARVLQLIAEIHASGRIATRQAVADILEVPVGKVDEHTKKLIEAGSVRRLLPGVFEPVDVMPEARPVHVSRLSGGWVKIEVGEGMLTLTAEEERMLAMSVKGAAEQFQALAAGRDLADQVADLRRRNTESLERDTAAKARIAELEEQVRVLMGIPKQLLI